MESIDRLNKKQLEMLKKMSKMEREFVLGLMVGMTQQEAYVDAGGSSTDYQTIASSAHNLRYRKKVNEFMILREELEMEKIRLIIEDQDEMKRQMIQRLYYQATTEITDIVEFQDTAEKTQLGEDENGDPIYAETDQCYWRLKNSDELSARARATIESVKKTKNGIELNMAKSIDSIRLLADLGGWKAPEKKEISGVNGEPFNQKPEMSKKELMNALKEIGFNEPSQLDDKEIGE